ncbi:MAG: hypothetical protein COA79_12900 [Planctomycetota bacterium]|nr:MAG: hypothetical protein COA79_12900 [Planctomycetota bacterium]
MFQELNSYFVKYEINFDNVAMTLLEKFWNKVEVASKFQDLTKITKDKDEILAKHFLDSFSPIFFMKEMGIELSKKYEYCVDIGTGGGFPGVPLGLYFSDKKWFLVDARNKKIQFLKTALSDLKLDQFIPYHGRAEEMSKKNKELIGNTGIITARAIKLDNKILNEVYNLLSDNGILIQLCGPSAIELPFSEKKKLIEIADFKPELSPLTIHHRIRVFQKRGEK